VHPITVRIVIDDVASVGSLLVLLVLMFHGGLVLLGALSADLGAIEDLVEGCAAVVLYSLVCRFELILATPQWHI